MAEGGLERNQDSEFVVSRKKCGALNFGLRKDFD